MRITSPRALGGSFALLRALACASATKHAYIAPSHETVVSTTEETEGPPSRHVIYIENRSTVPVTVFSITLSGCENVKQQCSPHPVEIRVRPGGRELAIRVEPVNESQGFGCHFGFSWHADSASTNALNALASNGSAEARALRLALPRAGGEVRHRPDGHPPRRQPGRRPRAHALGSLPGEHGEQRGLLRATGDARRARSRARGSPLPARRRRRHADRKRRHRCARRPGPRRLCARSARSGLRGDRRRRREERSTPLRARRARGQPGERRRPRPDRRDRDVRDAGAASGELPGEHRGGRMVAGARPARGGRRRR